MTCCFVVQVTRSRPDLAAVLKQAMEAHSSSQEISVFVAGALEEALCIDHGSCRYHGLGHIVHCLLILMQTVVHVWRLSLVRLTMVGMSVVFDIQD